MNESSEAHRKACEYVNQYQYDRVESGLYDLDEKIKHAKGCGCPNCVKEAKSQERYVNSLIEYELTIRVLEGIKGKKANKTLKISPYDDEESI